jgi:hypothetical protein
MRVLENGSVNPDRSASELTYGSQVGIEPVETLMMMFKRHRW